MNACCLFGYGTQRNTDTETVWKVKKSEQHIVLKNQINHSGQILEKTKTSIQWYYRKSALEQCSYKQTHYTLRMNRNTHTQELDKKRRRATAKETKIMKIQFNYLMLVVHSFYVSSSLVSSAFFVCVCVWAFCANFNGITRKVSNITTIRIIQCYNKHVSLFLCACPLLHQPEPVVAVCASFFGLAYEYLWHCLQKPLHRSFQLTFQMLNWINSYKANK